MTPDIIIDLLRNALFIAMLMAVVIIFPSLVVGLIVAVFQAATQINEQTLSFLPRLLATLLMLMYAGPWLGQMVGDFANTILTEIPFIIG